MPLPLIVGAAIVAGGIAAGGAIGYVSYRQFRFFGHKPQHQMLGYPIPFYPLYYGQPYSPPEYSYQYRPYGNWRLYLSASGY